MKYNLIQHLIISSNPNHVQVFQNGEKCQPLVLKMWILFSYTFVHLMH